MPYQALYRQWRPQTFSQVVGQRPVIDTLRNQVLSGRIAHAYLFCGSRGTGKTSTAKILAKAVNCEHPVNGDPCGHCENCRRAESEESLDIIEIDAASNNGVDEMRDLRETVKYPPQYGKYKVYIIDEVHMLSTSAFNALLKTLEEPPAHIIFILATTESQKLPATILSRCQRFDFGRIRSSEIAARLSEAVKGADATATDDALLQIARAAEGGLRDALSILDMCLGNNRHIDAGVVEQVLGTSNKSFLFKFSEALSRQDIKSVFSLIDQLMQHGQDPLVFAKQISSHIRSILAVKCCGDEAGALLDVTAEDLSAFKSQAETFTFSRLMRILDLYMQLETEMRYVSVPRTALENTSLKCCLQIEISDEQAFADRFIELEKRIESLEARIASGAVTAAAASPEKKIKAKSVSAANTLRPVESVKGEEKASADHQDAASVWKAAVQLFRKREPSVMGMLSQGIFAGREGNTFLWRANAGAGFFVNALNSESRNRTIVEILSEAAGENVAFKAISGQTQDTSVNENDDKFVQNLQDMFGTEAVHIIE